MNALLVATVSLALGGAPASGPDPHELVTQLGSPKFRERERAARELVRLGRAAKEALLKGRLNPDVEVSYRCEQLLPQALALDLAYRIEQFVGDKEGKLEHDLPLYKEFRAKVGSDEPARRLFAELVKLEGVMFEAIQDNPGRATEKITLRVNEKYQKAFGTPGLPGLREPDEFDSSARVKAVEIAALLFAASQPTYKPTPGEYFLSQFAMQPHYMQALKDQKGEGGETHRKLFYHYLESQPDENVMMSLSWSLCQHRIPGAADAFARLLKRDRPMQVWTKAQTMASLGTVGTKDHIAAFDGLLKDDTVVQAVRLRQGQGTAKVKDIALAMVIHLSGKNPRDYGFSTWVVHAQQVIPYYQLGFVTEDDRKSAFAKWEADRKKAAPKADRPAK